MQSYQRLTIKYEATLQDLNRQQVVQDLPDGLTHKIRNYYPGGIQVGLFEKDFGNSSQPHSTKSKIPKFS